MEKSFIRHDKMILLRTEPITSTLTIQCETKKWYNILLALSKDVKE